MYANNGTIFICSVELIYVPMYVCQRLRWRVYDTSLKTQDHPLNCWTPGNWIGCPIFAKPVPGELKSSGNFISKLSNPYVSRDPCFIRCKILRLRQFDSRRGNALKRIKLSMEILSSRPNLKISFRGGTRARVGCLKGARHESGPCAQRSIKRNKVQTGYSEFRSNSHASCAR